MAFTTPRSNTSRRSTKIVQRQKNRKERRALNKQASQKFDKKIERLDKALEEKYGKALVKEHGSVDAANLDIALKGMSKKLDSRVQAEANRTYIDAYMRSKR